MGDIYTSRKIEPEMHLACIGIIEGQNMMAQYYKNCQTEP